MKLEIKNKKKLRSGCHPVAVHIYTQTIHRTTQITTEQHITINVAECGACPVFASFTLAFALQLRRKKHEKTSVRIRKTPVRVQYTYIYKYSTLNYRTQFIDMYNRQMYKRFYIKLPDPR